MTSVTIEKSYLETLVRRAENNGQTFNSDPLNVTISRSEYDDLLRRCKEYDNLKRALYSGGIPDSSLETLIRGSGAPPPIHPADRSQENNYYTGGNNATSSIERMIARSTDSEKTDRNDWRPDRTEKREVSQGDSMSGKNTPENDYSSFPSLEKSNSPSSGEEQRQGSKHSTNGSENRTVVLKGLPERATHRDVVEAVRGGALVDIFLRSRERIASITFADAKAANEYLGYAKRWNVYIMGKPIEAFWSDRQFILPAYMATQLSNGASRNIVIRGVHPNLTEARIRADMEHIHNLIIVSITYAHGNAYISTNSVQKASFARTCMKSRIPYNSMRIEYFPDECAESLPRMPSLPQRELSQPAKKLNPMANRFQMLNIDGMEGADSEEEDDFPNSASVGGAVSWANTGIAV